MWLPKFGGWGAGELSLSFQGQNCKHPMRKTPLPDHTHTARHANATSAEGSQRCHPRSVAALASKVEFSLSLCIEVLCGSCKQWSLVTCQALVAREAEEEMFCFLCLFSKCLEHSKSIHVGLDRQRAFLRESAHSPIPSSESNRAGPTRGRGRGALCALCSARAQSTRNSRASVVWLCDPRASESASLPALGPGLPVGLQFHFLRDFSLLVCHILCWEP